VSTRSYQFRIYPTKDQEARLLFTLDLCRNLYNAALEQRIFAWKKRGKSISFYDQDKEVKDLRETFSEYKGMYSQVPTDVLARLDKAYQAFFRRVKKGDTPGFPRFKGKDRYDSFGYRSGFKFDGKRLYLSKLGYIRTKAWCPLPTEPKRVTITRKADGWYATFVCLNLPSTLLLLTGKVIGLDLGLKTLVMTSDGESLGSLDHIKKAEKELRDVQRTLSRKKRGSNRRRKCKEQLAKKHLHAQRVRKYQLDCLSRKLVNENDVIAVEDLDVTQMVSTDSKKSSRGLRRNIHLASWSTFTQMLSYKAEDAGKRVVKVDPKGTTQECSGCGRVVPKDLSVRVHECPHCGLYLDRDYNAAINVLNRGLRLLRGGPPVKGGPLKREGQWLPQIMVAG